jgi:hypothetical protein
MTRCETLRETIRDARSDNAAAARDVLDRVLGRAPVAVNLDIQLRKRLDEMSIRELRAFRAKWIAAQTLTPALIEATTTDISIISQKV